MRIRGLQHVRQADLSVAFLSNASFLVKMPLFKPENFDQRGMRIALKLPAPCPVAEMPEALRLQPVSESHPI